MAAPLSKVTKLNPQQKKFIRYYMQCGNMREAALRAGYNDKTYGSFLMRQEKVKTALQVAMERQGLNDEHLAKKLKEGLEAKYPEQLYKDGSPKQKAAPDHLARKNYLDLAFKLRGDYAPEKHEVVQKNVQVVINFDMARGLLDSGHITEAEVEELKRVEAEGEGVVSPQLMEHAE